MAGRLIEPFVVLHDPALVARIATEPWEVARALGGEVEMIERQPIRDVGGRSFASNRGPAPLHTDSQLYRGRPAHFQVLGCVRAARRGGESLIADSHAVTETDALFREVRLFPFVFGDVRATTFSAAGDDLIFTHSPRLPSLVELRPQTIALRDGDVLIVDNHRCAHGRNAFDDPSRELQRILIWLRDPPRSKRAWHARAAREGHAPVRMVDAPAGDFSAIVAEMIRGVPPGVLAKRHNLPEAWLYEFRDREGPLAR